MQKSKLFTLLGTFDEADWGNFKRYLKGEINPQSDPYLLYKHIASYSHQLDHAKLNADYVNEKLYPEKNPKAFRNILSRLSSYVMDYIAHVAYMADTRSKSIYLVAGLNKRGLYDLAIKHRDKYFSEIEKDHHSLWTPWYRHRMLHQMKYSDNAHNARRGSALLNELMHCYQEMDNRFRAYYELDSRQIEQIESDDKLPETKTLINYRQTNANNPYDILFALLIQLHEAESVDIYNEIVDYIKDNKFSKKDLLITYAHLKRHILKRIYQGDSYLQTYADLTIWALDEGFILNDKVLDPIRFYNVVSIFNTAMRWETSTELIDAKAPYIEKSSRNDIKNLALAHLYSYKLEPVKALELLQQPFNQRQSSKSTHRTLILLNLLHLHPGKYEFMDTQLTNFNSFIKRECNKKQISLRYYTNALNMSKVIKKMMRREITLAEQVIKKEEEISSRMLLLRIGKKCGLLK